MKTFKIFCIYIFFIVFSLLMISCEDSVIQYGSLSASIADETPKTIQPAVEELTFATYRIYGSHKTNEDSKVDKRFTSKSIQLDGLATGEWFFTVEGYNSDGVLLATSEAQTVDIEPNGITKTTYCLDWLTDGQGTIKLSIKVPSPIAKTIECQIREVGSEELFETITLTSPTIQDGLHVFEKSSSLNTGYYDATLIMKDNNGNSFGTALHPSIHIYKNLASSYEFSWESLTNLLQVDSPVPSINNGETIPCNAIISLSTIEEGTTIYYSFDDSTYSKYDKEIDLSTVSITGDSLSLYAYAEKDNMKTSKIENSAFKINHTSYSTEWAKDGTNHWHSATCGHSAATDESEHSWNTGEVITAPTCGTEGARTYTCTVCGRTKTDVISATGEHSWNSGEVTTVATCGKDGVKTYTCTVCGKTKTGVITATGEHTYVNYKCSVCGIWGKGPTGGYVFYDCDADNDSGNADGLISTECGWRYLEAAPEDLSYTNYSGNTDKYYPFGYYRTSPSGSNLTVGTKTAIGTGKANTEALVKAMGETTYASSSGTTKGIYAAKACVDYSITVNGVVYDDWFLPSKNELDLMYDNLKTKGLGSFAYYYWSSSEDSSDYARLQYFGNGDQYSYNRYYSYYVRPVRAFIECVHTWDLGVVTTPETCVTSGIKTFTCIECKQTKIEVISATDEHIWNAGEVTTATTCGKDGVRTYTCTVCGQTKTVAISATDEHTWNAGEVTTAATCGKNGVRTYICTVCGQTKTEVITATGEHTYVNYKCSVCGLWGKGPTGGYVFYDCDADNDSGNADGLISTECGWRYLEAAPEDLSVKYTFGYYRTSSSGSNSTIGTKTAIGTGKANTEALVKAMGESAYTDSSGTTKGIYAAKACADYSITVEGFIYDDWFLPSKDELDLMYDNLKAKDLGSFAYDYYIGYWSSSENSNGDAWRQFFFLSGNQNYYNRSSSIYVRPVRAF